MAHRALGGIINAVGDGRVQLRLRHLLFSPSPVTWDSPTPRPVSSSPSPALRAPSRDLSPLPRRPVRSEVGVSLSAPSSRARVSRAVAGDRLRLVPFVYLAFISLVLRCRLHHSTLTAVNTWFVGKRVLADVYGDRDRRHRRCHLHADSRVGRRELWLAYGRHSGVRHQCRASSLSTYVRGAESSPERIGMRPMEHPVRRPLGDQGRFGRDFTSTRACSTPVYWVMAVATMLRLSAMNISRFSSCRSWCGRGRRRWQQPSFALMTGLSGPGRVTMGWLGDRFPEELHSGVGMLSGCLSFVLLLFRAGDLATVALRRHLCVCGEREHAELGAHRRLLRAANSPPCAGTMSLVYTSGVAIAPVVAGYICDTTQSYSLVLWGMAFLPLRLVRLLLASSACPSSSDRTSATGHLLGVRPLAYLWAHHTAVIRPYMLRTPNTSASNAFGSPTTTAITPHIRCPATRAAFAPITTPASAANSHATGNTRTGDKDARDGRDLLAGARRWSRRARRGGPLHDGAMGIRPGVRVRLLAGDHDVTRGARSPVLHDHGPEDGARWAGSAASRSESWSPWRSTLSMAPQTDEFGTKVALLAGLVVVCAAGPLLDRSLPAPDRHPTGWAGSQSGIASGGALRRRCRRPRSRRSSASASASSPPGHRLAAPSPSRPTTSSDGPPRRRSGDVPDDHRRAGRLGLEPRDRRTGRPGARVGPRREPRAGEPGAPTVRRDDPRRPSTTATGSTRCRPGSRLPRRPA